MSLLWNPESWSQRLAELEAQSGDLKEAPLRRDVRSLGMLLGEVLREQAGEDLFAHVEALRQGTIRRRDAEARGSDEEAARHAASALELVHLSLIHIYGDARMLDDISRAALKVPEQALRSLLGCFLFSGDDVFKPLGVLSGGERNRYALARILVSPSNFLLLDEPTNHLDMRAKDVLLEALAAFSGTVVFVSHDRYFCLLYTSRCV